jgi:ATP-dependent Lhr-like helicase
VRQTVAYADLTDEEYQWILDFIEKGGQCLKAYPRYRKVVLEDDGATGSAIAQISRMHRMGIGTITSNTPVRIVYTNRKEIGTVEESLCRASRKAMFSFLPVASWNISR